MAIINRILSPQLLLVEIRTVVRPYFVFGERTVSFILFRARPFNLMMNLSATDLRGNL